MEQATDQQAAEWQERDQLRMMRRRIATLERQRDNHRREAEELRRLLIAERQKHAGQ